MNYLTALFALRERGQVREGETVLVHGASGGVGTATLQVARGLGVRTIGVVSTEEKAAFAREAGADETVLVDGFKDAVATLTGGRGVDAVVDVVGGDVFTDSLRCLGEQGRLLVVGFASGRGIPEVKVNRLLLTNVDVRGVGMGSLREYQADVPARAVGPAPAHARVRCRPAADRRDVRARRLRPGAAGHGRPPHAGQERGRAAPVVGSCG